MFKKGQVLDKETIWNLIDEYNNIGLSINGSKFIRISDNDLSYLAQNNYYEIVSIGANRVNIKTIESKGE